MNLNSCRSCLFFGRTFVLTATALAISTLVIAEAQAQSGTRTPPSTTPAQAGSGTKAAANAVGLQGYCPVCVIEMKKWMKGSQQFAAQYDGKTYLFPGEEQKQVFVSNPAKYTPVLGGDCVVALVEMGKRVPGSLQFAALHENRLYLFANEQAKGMFQSNKEKYANADVALGGNCSVCRVEMNQDVDGSPQFTSLHKGMRYLFPGEKQQQMFNANPTKYEVK